MKKQASIVTIMLVCTSLYCSTQMGTDYLSQVLPDIINGLKQNQEALIDQKKIINLTEKTLDTFVKDQEMTFEEAESAKQELTDIFDTNFANASYQQRIAYQIQRPFQFIYSKFTDPDATYLERLAYGAAVAAGVIITGYTLYQAGKYAQSQFFGEQPKTLPEKNDALPPHLSELTDNINAERAKIDKEYNEKEKKLEERARIIEKRKVEIEQQKQNFEAKELEKIEQERKNIEREKVEIEREKQNIRKEQLEKQRELERAEKHINEEKIRIAQQQNQKRTREQEEQFIQEKLMQEKQYVQEGNIPYHSPDLVDLNDIDALANRYNEIKNQEYVLVGGTSVHNPNFNAEDLRVAKKNLDKAIAKKTIEEQMHNIGKSSITQDDINKLYAVKKNWQKISALINELRITVERTPPTGASPDDQLNYTEYILQYLNSIAPQIKEQLFFNPNTTFKIDLDDILRKEKTWPTGAVDFMSEIVFGRGVQQ